MRGGAGLLLAIILLGILVLSGNRDAQRGFSYGIGREAARHLWRHR